MDFIYQTGVKTETDLITQSSDVSKICLQVKVLNSNVKMYERMGFLICLVLSEMLIFIDGSGILIEL